MPKEVVPAILTANKEELKEKLKVLASRGGAVHIDVMDGVLVRENSFSFDCGIGKFKNSLRKLAVEIHLMVKDPLSYIAVLNMLKPSLVILHQESFSGVGRLRAAASELDSLNINTSVTAFPGSPLWLLEEVKNYQIMGVYPGRSGQTLLPDTLNQVEALKAHAINDMIISVDGGVNFENGPLLFQSGAARVIMNSAFWQAKNPDQEIKRITKGGYGLSSSN